MLKVLYGLKNFEGKSKFKTWLYSITYNDASRSIGRNGESVA
jgi:DNA-directed RNA polymerase specialized sigma24 family protein